MTAMPTKPPPRRPPRSLYLYLWLGFALFVFLGSFALLAPILLSFLLILLLSLAMNPVILWIRTWLGGRKRATSVVALAFVLLLGGTGWTFFGPMRTSVTKLTERLPAYWERLQKPLIKMEKQGVLSEQKLQTEANTVIVREKTAAGDSQAAPRAAETPSPQTPNESGSLRSNLGQMLKIVAGSFTAVALNAAQIMVVLVTVFFGVTFTLMNPRPIFSAIFSFVPERHHERTLSILRRIGKFVPEWALATLLGMATIGTLVFLLMWPIFGFADALGLGLIAGILEAVPFLGPLLAAVPALLLAMGEGGITPLWVVLAYLSIQALENNVILPLIMARSMKLHPLAVIFSMLLCVAAFGVLGVLIAAPMVAIVIILHDELFRKRFLPTATDGDLERLARSALHEKVTDK